MTEQIQTQTSIPSKDEKKNGDSASRVFPLVESSLGSTKGQKSVEKKTYCLKSMIDLVKYPVLTEKTSIVLTKNRQYTFDVDKRLSKTQIKKLFETLFEVNVIGVNTHIPPRKTVRVGLARGHRPSYKRAIITLKENQTLNYNLNFASLSAFQGKSPAVN